MQDLWEVLELRLQQSEEKLRLAERRFRWLAACALATIVVMAISGPRTHAYAQVGTLDARIAALEAKTQYVSNVNNEMVVSGTNLRIENGTGSTATTNGLGNLIVGYNEFRNDGSDIRTGSHNLVIGYNNSYSGLGSIVSGAYATSTKGFANVLGGDHNTASNGYSVVVGGYNNAATGISSVVAGGQGNTAYGGESFVSGGQNNTASASSSAVNGGFNNVASGYAAIVVAGLSNTAGGNYASVIGGHNLTGATTYGASSGPLTVAGALGVNGASTLAAATASSLQVTGPSTLNGIIAAGAAKLGSTLDVSGVTTLNALTCNGVVDFASTFNVDGATTLSTLDTGSTTVAGNLSVTGMGNGIYFPDVTRQITAYPPAIFPFAYDGFDYPAGSGVAHQDGGVGNWGDAWNEYGQGNTNSVITTAGLSFGSLATSGNAIMTTSDFPVGHARQFLTSPGKTGGVLYISFLMQPLEPATNGYCGIGYGGVFIGKGSSGFFGLQNDGGGAEFDSTVRAIPNQTVFLVARITFGSGADTVDLFVNPTPGQPLPAIPNATKQDRNTGTPADFNFGSSVHCVFDEIRFGSTFNDVSPVR